MKLLITTQKVNLSDDNLASFHAWILEFAKHCERVTVICLEEGPHDLPANVQVVSLGKERGNSKWSQLIRFYWYAFIGSRDYDAVFVHMNPEYVILGGMPWRLLGKRVSLWYTHKSVNLRLRLAQLLTHTIFTASKESFRLASNKVTVTGHGIDTDFFAPQTDLLPLTTPSQPAPIPLEIDVVSVGRISESKRLREMIAVIEDVRINLPETSIAIAGEAITQDDKRYKETLISDNTNRKWVKFMGRIPHQELPPFYRQAKLFLNFSKTGSLDRAVLEAMSCGLPVISTNEAFAPLGKEVYIPHNETQLLTATIKERLGGSDSDRGSVGSTLREWVVRNHNLKTLIPRIVAALERR